MLRAMAEERARSAERLVALREARGLSQEDLAHAASVTSKTISRWENQRHDPSPKTVQRVAGVLEVEPAFLWEPPAPLGLEDRGSFYDQLERIEQKLDLLLARVNGEPEELARAFEQASEATPPSLARKRASKSKSRVAPKPTG
jgi:transcriptional regulator with XRE-family HTH domain